MPCLQAAVDWHDFVVVETIDFYDDEDASLPAPMPLAEVISQLRAARVEEPTSAQADAAMDVEMDEEERELVQPSLTVLPPPPPPLPPPDAPEPQMKIVRNYKRTDAAPALAAANAPQLVVSPITGELVPVDQMAEHMRISLIDPKWKVEREAMLGKLRGSTIASDEEIAKNVVGLARTRPDIFGSAEDMSVAVSAEMEKHRRAEERAPGAAARPPMQPEPPRAPMLLPPLAMQWPPAMPPPGYPMQGAMPPGYPPGYPGLPPPGYAMPSMPPIGMYGLPPPHFPGPQYGIPMQGGVQPPAITPAEEPDLKRQRTEDVQVSEEDFAEAHPEPVSVEVAVPEVEGDATLRGQTVKLIVGVMETIGDVKARLAAAIGIPASKQKIMHRGTFLKDTSTLAAYNFGTGTSLIMGIKSRGKK
jgi:splicing factor 3A subunit 1